jgi:hypothetical protein
MCAIILVIAHTRTNYSKVSLKYSIIKLSCFLEVIVIGELGVGYGIYTYIHTHTDRAGGAKSLPGPWEALLALVSYS